MAAWQLYHTATGRPCIWRYSQNIALFNGKKDGCFVRSFETRALFGACNEQFTIKQEMLQTFSCLGHFRTRTELHFRDTGSFF